MYEGDLSFKTLFENANHLTTVDKTFWLASVDGGFIMIRKPVREDELVYTKIWKSFVTITMDSGIGEIRVKKLLGM